MAAAGARGVNARLLLPVGLGLYVVYALAVVVVRV
jgi:hypothetical protein